MEGLNRSACLVIALSTVLLRTMPACAQLPQRPSSGRIKASRLMDGVARGCSRLALLRASNRDHVHVLIGIPPHVSVSRAVQYLKGKNSQELLGEYAMLTKRYGGQHLWGRGYWVATSGNVTDEVWKKYIEDQKPEEPEDNFKVM